MTDLPYKAIWERELRAGMYGQDRAKPSTWRIDALYRAVCWQLKAEEAEEALERALDQDAHVDTIAALVDELNHEVEMAHHVFLTNTESDAAA